MRIDLFVQQDVMTFMYLSGCYRN